MANRHIIDILKEGVKDITRANMFEVILNRPGTPSADFVIAQNLIRNVQVPQFTLGEIELRRMGRIVNIPGALAYTPLVMSFHDDSEGRVRKYIEDWIRIYINQVQYGVFSDDIRNFISGSVEIYQLDGNHERITKTVCYKAFPKFIGEIDLNHESDDTLNNFNVTFAYSYYLYSNNAIGNFDDLETTDVGETR